MRPVFLAGVVTVTAALVASGCGVNSESRFEEAQRHVREAAKQQRAADRETAQLGDEYNAIARKAWRIEHELKTDREKLAE